MRTYISVAGLFLAAAVFHGCAHPPGTSSKSGDDYWQECAKTDGQLCPSKKITGKIARDLFNAVTGAGAEIRRYPDMSVISVLGTSCTKAAGEYHCSFKYHKSSDGPLPAADIKDTDGKAKSVYQALAAAGVREDCAAASCKITIVSIGCMEDPPECYLSKNSAMEVAW